MGELLAVDRIAGGIAVCEGAGRVMREIPLAELPEGVKEGDVLRETPDGYVLDPEERERRRRRNRDLFAELTARRKDPGEGKKESPE